MGMRRPVPRGRRKPVLNVGLIGAGFMGRAHAFAYTAASQVFDLPVEPVLHTLAERDQPTARAAAQALGFARSSGDWRQLVDDPAIDLIDITTPPALHSQMALAAIAAGKHVYCEKPLAPTAGDAQRMADAAAAARVKTQVGFNYLCNPMLRLARDIIAAGELGEIVGYRGIHAEDYMSDPAVPFSFRHEPAGGGALADLGSHALAAAEFLLGPVAAVLGDCVTVHTSRPDGHGRLRTVEVDDITRALVRFSCGATGSIEANWVATGRKMQHDFEVHGARGALRFSQERLNELHLYRNDDPAGRHGFRRIEAGPEHPPYGRFCVAPGHQLGFNDLKTIEVAEFLTALARDGREPCGFAVGARVQAVIGAVRKSARECRWVPC